MKEPTFDQLLATPMAAPATEHENFALAAVKETHIFYTGGSKGGEAQRKTLFYNVERDEWKEGPDMNVAREYHSSCSFADFTYVIGGRTQNGMTDSIERLNSTEIVSRCYPLFFWSHTWQHIQVAGSSLPACHSALVCPLNDTEIIIMGGVYNEFSVFALHHESHDLRQVTNQLEHGVNSSTNSTRMLSPNLVALRVTAGLNGTDYLKSYTPSKPHTFQLIKELS